MRKHGDLTFTIQHVGTGIEKKLHDNDICLAGVQTEWNIDPTWFRGRETNNAYYPNDTDKKERTNDSSITPALSMTSTYFEEQPFAKLKKMLKPKF